MTFLIIEDSKEYAKIVEHYLASLADKTVVAESWETAWPLLINVEIRLAWIDLIIPPDVQIEEALIHIAKARAQRPDLVIVVVSGAMSENLSDRLLAAGADAYLHKMDARSEEQVAALILLAATAAVKRGVDVEDLLNKALRFMNSFVAPIEPIHP